MMHFYQKQTFIKAFVLFFIFVSSAWKLSISGPQLREQDQVVSNRFKTLAASDRLVEFNELKLLFKVYQAGQVQTSIEGDFIGAHTTTVEELIFTLGEPDQRIQESQLQYNLNAAGTCKAVLGINKDGFLTYIGMSGC